MKNKAALILIGLIIGFLSTVAAQSHLFQYKWQEGDVYHYKLTVKSPQFGSQEFLYDQIVEKLFNTFEQRHSLASSVCKYFYDRVNPLLSS